MENRVEKLTIYKDALENLYSSGLCKGIISKKKIRLLVGIISNEIKNEKNKVLEKSGE